MPGFREQKINKALFKLKTQLPSDRSLTSLRIGCDGGSVVIRSQDQHDPDSGQMHMDFSVADLAGSVAPLAKKAAEIAQKSEHMSSDDWFDLGVDLEAVSPDDAPAAYMRALELDPGHSDAHVNIGRLLQEAGQLDSAEALQRGFSGEKDNMLAAFNLGDHICEDMGRIEEAINIAKGGNG